MRDVDGGRCGSFDGEHHRQRRRLSSVIRPDGKKVAGTEFLEFDIDDVHPAAYDIDARASR